MTTLYVPIGPPGCGKSRLAQEAVIAGLVPKEAVVCPDDYRKILTGAVADQSANVEVFAIVNAIVDRRLGRGLDVWVDATNIKQSIWTDMARRFRARLVTINFATLPLSVVLERNANRIHVVPEDVVQRLHEAVIEWSRVTPSISVQDFRDIYLNGSRA